MYETYAYQHCIKCTNVDLSCNLIFFLFHLFFSHLTEEYIFIQFKGGVRVAQQINEKKQERRKRDIKVMDRVERNEIIAKHN